MNIPSKAPREAESFFMNIRKDLMKIVDQIDSIVYDCDEDGLPNTDVLHRRILESDINPRTVNCLRMNNIYTVGELAGSTIGQLQTLPGMGSTGISLAIAFGASIGFPVEHPHLRGWQRDKSYIAAEYDKMPMRTAGVPAAFLRRFFAAKEFPAVVSMKNLMEISLEELKMSEAFAGSQTPELLRDWFARELGFAMKLTKESNENLLEPS